MRSRTTLVIPAMAASAMIGSMGSVAVIDDEPMPRRRQDDDPPPPVKAAPAPRTPTPAEAERLRNAELKRSRKAAKLKERGRL